MGEERVHESDRIWAWHVTSIFKSLHLGSMGTVSTLGLSRVCSNQLQNDLIQRIIASSFDMSQFKSAFEIGNDIASIKSNLERDEVESLREI